MIMLGMNKMLECSWDSYNLSTGSNYERTFQRKWRGSLERDEIFKQVDERRILMWMGYPTLIRVYSVVIIMLLIHRVGFRLYRNAVILIQPDCIGYVLGLWWVCIWEKQIAL